MRKTQKLPTVQSIRNEIEQGTGEQEHNEEEWMHWEDSYTEADLQKQWKAYIAQLKKDHKKVEYATLNREFSLSEDHTITLEFENAVQSLVLERLQQDLTTFLRRKLKNKHIRISAHVRKEEVEKKVYTNKEKFEYLAEKYPDLRKLQQNLNLDTEF